MIGRLFEHATLEAHSRHVVPIREDFWNTITTEQWCECKYKQNKITVTLTKSMQKSLLELGEETTLSNSSGPGSH